jgi:serine/threonine-protein kinase
MFTAWSRPSSAQAGSGWLSRAAVETLLLVCGLLAIGGFIVFWVWPPGESYLYRQAEILMASSRRADWLTALEEYLDPLDQRFPDNPYREQTQKWRDKILLDEAEGRANILAAPVRIKGTEAKTKGESQFVVTNAVASEASERGDDLTALRQWQEMAGSLDPKDPDERKWHLLALHRVSQLETAMRDRRQYVEKQLRIAEEALRNDQPDQAMAIRNKLVEKYSGYKDLADLFPAPVAPSRSTTPPAEPGAPESSQSSPQERPANPSASPKSEDSTAPDPSKSAPEDE